MAKRQTRRSISIKGTSYQRVKDHCADTGQSISGYLEALITEKMDEAGVPIPDVVTSYPERKAEPETAWDGTGQPSAHFTF